jgi:hypothetical protein
VGGGYLGEAFGIRIRSDIELPLAEAHELRGKEWSVRLSACAKDAASRGGEGEHLDPWLIPGPMSTRLEISPTGNLLLASDGLAPESYLRELILGLGLKALMQTAGMVCFDGGAVEVQGKAVLLIGRSSAGKSSLLARLQQLGGHFIADDLAVVQEQNDGAFFVRRGALRSKLWPDALLGLGETPSRGAEIAPGLGKRLVPVEESRSRSMSRIGAIVVCRVDRVGEPGIERVDFRRALPLLLAASARLEHLASREARTRQARVLMGIASRLPVFCLSTNPMSFSIPDLLRFFEDRLDEITA